MRTRRTRRRTPRTRMTARRMPTTRTRRRRTRPTRRRARPPTTATPMRRPETRMRTLRMRRARTPTSMARARTRMRTRTTKTPPPPSPPRRPPPRAPRPWRRRRRRRPSLPRRRSWPRLPPTRRPRMRSRPRRWQPWTTSSAGRARSPPRPPRPRPRPRACRRASGASPRCRASSSSRSWPERGLGAPSHDLFIHMRWGMSQPPPKKKTPPPPPPPLFPLGVLLLNEVPGSDPPRCCSTPPWSELSRESAENPPPVSASPLLSGDRLLLGVLAEHGVFAATVLRDERGVLCPVARPLPSESPWYDRGGVGLCEPPPSGSPSPL
mmetsp:Transcript_21545/g.54347  ORF Transcript_21545/g.54347 Transcript_21545/m.54347 type:complete len:323 (+) Transcript_21545:743-1711(+)